MSTAASNYKMQIQNCKSNSMQISRKTKSYLVVIGTCLIYFAMGLYFAAGNTSVYLTSYLIYRSESDMNIGDGIWFLSISGFSAFLLPVGGWLGDKIGIRQVSLIGGLLQSAGIFATYFALDTTFLIAVIAYGGSFLVSLATCYTPVMVNVGLWHPTRKGLVTGLGSAAMAVAPTLFTPLITWLVNPNNVSANQDGLFDDPEVLDRTKESTLTQGYITLTLFLAGIALTFPSKSATEEDETSKQKGSKEDKSVWLTSYVRFDQADDLGPVKSEQQFTKVELCQPEVTEDTISCSIKPTDALKTGEFWLLSMKVYITELLLIYLLFMYKPYGQTFIADDYYLSTIGAACAVSNTLGRILMGFFKDYFSYKAVSIPLSGLSMLAIVSMPLLRDMDKIYYGAAAVLAVGGVGSQYGIIPPAVQDSFGEKNASVNIGFVYMSTAFATVSSALLSQYMTPIVGWDGMIYLVSSLAALDFVFTFLMPSNPRKKLVERYNQFYSKDTKVTCQMKSPSGA